MDSSESSHPTTRSGEKLIVTVDNENKPAIEGLPDGWLQEYRPRKTRSGSKIKGDMFYIDPTNTHEFRSLKDVHRYLKSGDNNDCVVTPIKRKNEDLQIARSQSHHAGRPSGFMQLDTDHENVPSSEPKDVSKGKLIELELQKARVNNQPLDHKSASREEANVEQKPKEKKQKAKPVKQIAVPLRASPRLTALKINQKTNSIPRDGAADTQIDVTDQLQPKQTQSRRSKTNSSLVPQNKDGVQTTSVSENSESMCSPAPQQILGASAACSLGDIGCQNASSGLPTPLQQLGFIETADAMPGCSLSALFGSIWSDPCLEFAFKTLTGDIPVLDNDLAVANYFLPPQDMNKGIPSNCSSSTYDGTRKSHSQVDRARLPMPRPSDKFQSSGWFPPQ